MENALLRRLQDPRAYPHSVAEIRVIETHISWVILTGTFAYKIKKPVKLDFLDFSTLAQRHYYCREEFRLNLRLAPSIYLDVVPISGLPEQATVGTGNQIIEYAVKMRQFPEERQLNRLLSSGRIYPEDLEKFAESLSKFHSTADNSQSQKYGEPQIVAKRLTDNIRQYRKVADEYVAQSLHSIERWYSAELSKNHVLIQNRAVAGTTRECHGDLHLGNLVALDEGITAFDCIEFDPQLRWIDTLDDTAFLAMDLINYNHADLAFAFLDSYLNESGDHAAIPLLRMYMVNRCIVRAKVSALKHSQSNSNGEGVAKDYRATAQYLINPLKPALILMHGLPASGKSWLAKNLVSALPGLRVSSDLERKRLAGLSKHASSGSPPGGGIYDAAHHLDTYQRLLNLAEIILSNNFYTIVDATFLRNKYRELFYELAERSNVQCVVVDCQAPVEVLKARILKRRTTESDSEADLQVLSYAQIHSEPLQNDPRATILNIDTSRKWDSKKLADNIRLLARTS